MTSVEHAKLHVMAARLGGLDGVFVGSHAVAEGLMTRRLTRRQLRERGHRRLVQGVYALPELPVDHQLYCRAVSLLLPPEAVIAGRSAACWHGAPLAGPGDLVTVIVRRGLKWTGPRGIRVHRTDLTPDEHELVDDVPVTTASRTAWDVATLDPLRDSVATLDAMLRAGSVSLWTLEGMARSGSGRWRVGRVRRAVELVDPRSESPPESWVRVGFALARLPASVPQYEGWVDGCLLGRLDFAWPELRLAVEYEGAYHFDGLQIVRDDARIARLVAAGWQVIRLSAADLRDMELVITRVRSAIDERSSLS